MIRHTQPRPAFTLIELLVAMSLAVVILALAVGVSQSSAFESYKVTGSADRLSQWMLVAKNRALRDKAPRGIRLIADPSNANLIREVAYIEQPEPIPSTGELLKATRLLFYYPARVVEVSPTMMTPGSINFFYDGPFSAGAMGAPLAPSDRSVFLNIEDATPAARTAVLNELTATLQPGDLISIPELRSVLKLGNPVFIAAPAGSPGVSTTTITLKLNVQPRDLPNLGRAVMTYHASSTRDGTPHPSIPSSPNNGTLSTTTYGIIRAPRPLLGEPTQQLPSGMAVDLSTNPSSSPAGQSMSLNPPTADSAGNRDIMFSPSGEVIGATSSITALLLRDTLLSGVTDPLNTHYDKAGQMILICIYNRTGAIATQPVNPPATPADPYKFATDGINTGL